MKKIVVKVSDFIYMKGSLEIVSSDDTLLLELYQFEALVYMGKVNKEVDPLRGL